MASFTRSIDTALKVLLFDKFADILGIDKSGTTAQNINKGVVQIPVEIAMRELAEKRGETFLEFINFWRVGTSPSMSRQRTPAARRGLYVANTDDDKSGTIHIKAMPIDLNYNIWFCVFIKTLYCFHLNKIIIFTSGNKNIFASLLF